MATATTAAIFPPPTRPPRPQYLPPLEPRIVSIIPPLQPSPSKKRKVLHFDAPPHPPTYPVVARDFPIIPYDPFVHVPKPPPKQTRTPSKRVALHVVPAGASQHPLAVQSVQLDIAPQHVEREAAPPVKRQRTASPPPLAEPAPADVMSGPVPSEDATPVDPVPFLFPHPAIEPVSGTTDFEAYPAAAAPPAKKRRVSAPRRPKAAPAAAGSTPAPKPKRRAAPKRTSRASSASLSVSDSFSPSPARSSRSVSVTLDRFDAARIEEPIPRDVCLEDCGTFGPGVVTTGMKVVDMIGRELYGPYFDGPFDLANPPTVELVYPATGAKEEFPLVFPKDRDDYQPINNCMVSIELMLKYYLTPIQSYYLGWLPAFSMSEYIYDRPNLPPIEDERAYIDRKLTIWAQIRNGIIWRDQAMFVRGVEEFNLQLSCLRAMHFRGGEEPLKRNVRAMSGLHQEIVRHICEETHHRTVGPNVKMLNGYKAWSNEVYGEFLPPFITELVYRTGISPTSKILDLGSGTCQVLIQASLLSGCSALGVELRPEAAKFADLQCAEYEVRARMWGVDCGKGVKPVKGDFTECEEVRRWIGEADVVFCNNYAFRPALNDTLKNMFLDCKEGCKIVSLRPFRPPSFKITRHNMDDPAARLVTEIGKYGSQDVSWAGSKGEFYIQTVDPGELRAFAAKNGMV